MIWTCNTFTGYYPVGTAAVVEAETAEQASAKLVVELDKIGLPQREPPRMVPFYGGVVILDDGNY